MTPIQTNINNMTPTNIPPLISVTPVTPVR